MNSSLNIVLQWYLRTLSYLLVPDRGEVKYISGTNETIGDCDHSGVAFVELSCDAIVICEAPGTPSSLPVFVCVGIYAEPIMGLIGQWIALSLQQRLPVEAYSTA